ncbi:NUDIX hydrolase [Glycomyces lechevalierae]|uniref:8-oxo-dGTP pyrophosphatase MutT (NUDIX family) n=1 Tax=Glycomyces lechevalierae TaxID=256034 RepID=A0A9X3PLJ9_9ACTN|nr:NUDIX hydrolase [Glycomyces lechevalierae]MDA1386255.1 NUDIX hydrolase [Glycomyces lechevalierae]MDR7338272.1 8-oxo-dGTP pyrophosphatase MutT (NUDIX family) [Glycomyces lechevalierae]
MKHVRLPASVLRALAPMHRLWWRVRKPNTFGVKVLLRDDAGRFLVVRHSYSDPTRWGLPGGGYHPTRETPAEAGAREVAEELSLTLNPNDFVELNTITTTLEAKRDTLTILTAATPTTTVTTSPELAEARWISNVGDLSNAPVSRWLLAALAQTA